MVIYVPSYPRKPHLSVVIFKRIDTRDRTTTEDWAKVTSCAPCSG